VNLISPPVADEGASFTDPDDRGRLRPFGDLEADGHPLGKLTHVGDNADGATPADQLVEDGGDHVERFLVQ
jgi:hypothetical protein